MHLNSIFFKPKKEYRKDHVLSLVRFVLGAVSLLLLREPMEHQALLWSKPLLPLCIGRGRVGEAGETGWLSL